MFPIELAVIFKMRVLSQSLSCSSAKSIGSQAKILKKTRLGAESSGSLMNYWLFAVILSIQKVTIILCEFVHCRMLSLIEHCPNLRQRTTINLVMLTAASACALLSYTPGNALSLQRASVTCQAFV